MNDDTGVPRPRLSDEELSALLENAARIDAVIKEGLTLDEAREIALQAGISAAAISTAINHHLKGHALKESTSPWGFRAIFTGLAIGSGLGTALCLVRPFVSGDFAILTVAGAALLPALVIALVIAGEQKHRRFQSTNLALWAATLLVWSSVGGPTSEFADLFFLGGWLAALGSVLGSAIIGIRKLPDRINKLGQGLRTFLRRSVRKNEPTSDAPPSSIAMLSTSTWVPRPIERYRALLSSMAGFRSAV
jgi:hypothetical protein